MFDPSLVKTESEAKRHLGHTKVGFAARTKKHGYTLTNPETQESIDINKRPPNRKERRAYLSVAPRKIRLMAKESRRSKKPWYTYVWQYFSPEDIVAMKQQPEEIQEAVKRQVLNALKRRRRGEARA